MAATAMLFLGGLQAVGSIVGGIEERNNARATEQAARLSSLYARQDAANELRIATSDAEKQRRSGRQAVAEQTAAFSQSGFAISDSAAMSVQQSATEAELDAMNIQYKGVLRNRAGMIEAENYEAQADAARRVRKSAMPKAILGAATNLLSGYAKYSGSRIA